MRVSPSDHKSLSVPTLSDYSPRGPPREPDGPPRREATSIAVLAAIANALPSRRLRLAGPPHGCPHAPPPRVAPAPTPGRRRVPPAHPADSPPQVASLPGSQIASPAVPARALEGSGPRRALLTLFLDGRRFALQVSVEPRDLATKRVGTVLDLHKSMTFGRIEDGF